VWARISAPQPRFRCEPPARQIRLRP
jgi:hypothetical protein